MLTTTLYLLTAPTLAGALVLIALSAPSLGFADLHGIGVMAGAGFAAGLPLALVFSWLMRRGSRPAQ